jgi:transglutaminase-like putative cysteine protease
MEPPATYLRTTEVLDWHDREVLNLARTLAERAGEPVEIARRCFEWVRDEVRHSHDYQLNPTTCAASEVLRYRTGYCYAKCHLLVALLRANGIPAGLCYQRLSRDENGPPFCLHGLAAVFLPELGWYRADPRGNRDGIDAQFTPPVERLAFAARVPGEADLPGVYPAPLAVVVAALRIHPTWDLLWQNLPDLEPGGEASAGGEWPASSTPHRE